MVFRFLAAGDIHLGRRSSRVPQNLGSAEFSPEHAWFALVQAAISQKVDAVALTGDVVDQDSFYEAFSTIQEGVRQLVDAGIEVIAVAGNHDFDVLPRLTKQIEGIQLLGQGGLWETIPLESQDGMRVRFVGWSFPRRHVNENPLTNFTTTEDSVPTIGLLHCDCPAQSSSYGPVSLADLKSRDLDVWALGHIHIGKSLSDDRPSVFYTGSLQGLDPSETGPHGTRLVTLEAGEQPKLELQPLAALQWEHSNISLDTISTVSALEEEVTKSMQDLHEAIQKQQDDNVRAVGCRLCFTGRTSLHRDIPSIATKIIDELRPSYEGISFFVEKIQNETRPDVALEELARSSDPVGLLAQKLLVLDREEPDDEYRSLLSNAREAIKDKLPQTVYTSLPDYKEQLTDGEIKNVLSQSGFKALDLLLAQKEGDQ